MTDDRAQAQMGNPSPFGTFLVTSLIAAIVIINTATEIGQSTDLNARLAASLALLFGGMLLSILIVSGMGPEVAGGDET